MGQAKQRGTHEQRLAQALAANATLEAELRETASPMLKRFIEKYGVNKLRLHLDREGAFNAFAASNNSVNAQNEARKQSLVDSILSEHKQTPI